MTIEDMKANQETLRMERNKLNQQINELERNIVKKTQKDIEKNWVGKCFKIDDGIYCKVINYPQINETMNGPEFFEYHLPSLFVDTTVDYYKDYPIYVDTLFSRRKYEEIGPELFWFFYKNAIDNFEAKILDPINPD